MEYKGLMGGFYKITEWIMRVSGSNLLWVLCSSPFLFVLMTKFLYMQNPEAPPENATLYLMAILAPFTIFPATAALFTVVRKWVMGESDLSIIKLYFRGYKENYKQSMVGGLFYTLLFVIMYVDYYFYMTQLNNMQLLGMIMMIFLVLLSISLFNFFSLVAHYHLKVTLLIKNAILLTIIRPFRALSTLICVVVLAFLTLRFMWLVFIGFATLTALVAFYNFFIAYNKIQEKVEKMREAEERDAATEAEASVSELSEGEAKEKD
ncbi:hypothetical protein J25TS5_12100 [Paenibacillus faecis]|uniref:DUF624 domain-containing protein n=1 Tax=Paenibacillus faecis TaxID=862114 RepID=A0A5D0D124_9BACL|nr:MULTISPECIES: DUF624 domain-containing protein [Paenibacillus]MCA1291593.1 DUF624 domain-containing protein [Paenibacillus sp. alder61]TYA14837.1 DUF624 domain-containing protein [Paenibacillus faecis]GIO84278.1 hypothetical protein J25TS5_12100 [Paenibacillus faecis]